MIWNISREGRSPKRTSLDKFMGCGHILPRLWTNWQADTTENITCSKTTYAGGKSMSIVYQVLLILAVFYADIHQHLKANTTDLSLEYFNNVKNIFWFICFRSVLDRDTYLFRRSLHVMTYHISNFHVVKSSVVSAFSLSRRVAPLPSPKKIG